MRKHGKSLLFLPAFDDFDSVEEFITVEPETKRDCPPQKWYQDGVLLIEEPFVSQLLSHIPSLEFESITEISEREMDMMLEFESMIKEKKKQFTA